MTIKNLTTGDSPESQPFSQKVLLINRRSPRELFLLDDNIPYHATRLLLLMLLAGKPQNKPKIEGRIKLVKLDFFVRYPQFLEKAVHILSANKYLEKIEHVLEKGPTVESHMIRYKYGPWDRRYYMVLAYLSGKALIDIQSKDGVDIYSLTDNGYWLVDDLIKLPEFETIIECCQIVGNLFGSQSGGQIKDFIYRHYPEVVRTPYNQFIPSTGTENDHA